MFEFTYLFLFRSLSGLQNGLGYAKLSTWRIVVTVALIAAAGFLNVYFAFQPIPLFPRLITMLLSIISMAGALGVEDSFNPEMDLMPRDVHFWESFATGGVVLAWTIGGGNILLIIASVYPALILHKGFVNIGAGLKWWDVRTDDKTGRTFRIPMLGITIVRGGNAWRIFLAIVSLALAAATGLFGWKVTLVPLVIDLWGA